MTTHDRSDSRPTPWHAIVTGDGMQAAAATLALHEHGIRVSTLATRSASHRRNPTRSETSGVDPVVLDPAIEGYLNRFDVADPAAVSTVVDRYRYLAPDGTVASSFGTETQFTTADVLQSTITDALPASIRGDPRVVDLDAEPLETSGDEVRVTDTAGDRHHADLLVAADGWLSPTRQHSIPDVSPDYAGYVSWHGTIHESTVPHDLVEQFADAITVSQGDQDLLVATLLPGADGTTMPGHRRLHWVWYAPVSARDLGSVLTDREGTNHDREVPPGGLQDHYVSNLRERAADHAPQFTRLVRATPDPGVTPVVDLAVPSAAIGRTALVGEAAFTARHHTATSTPKAFQDVTALTAALDRYDVLDDALDDWSATQSLRGRQLVEQGRQTDLERLVGQA